MNIIKTADVLIIQNLPNKLVFAHMEAGKSSVLFWP